MATEFATDAEIRAARKNAEFILDNGEFYTPEQWRWKTLDERLDRIEAMLRELGAGAPKVPTFVTCGVCGASLSFAFGAANYCQALDGTPCRHPQMIVGRRPSSA